MYPSGELERLSRHKRSLVARAAVTRASCYVSGETSVRPLLWIDTILGVWRRISPFVATGTMLFSRNRFGRRAGALGLALKWAPAIWKIIKSLRQPDGVGRASSSDGEAAEPVRAARGSRRAG